MEGRWKSYTTKEKLLAIKYAKQIEQDIFDLNTVKQFTTRNLCTSEIPQEIKDEIKKELSMRAKKN